MSRLLRAPGRTVLDNARILLVDDEPDVLAGLRRILHGRGLVHEATDPHEALELVAGLPDLAVVVSDMRMPGMDGAAFLAEVRERAPDAVRVLLTGYSAIEAAVAAVNDGQIFRFLWKPCPPETFRSCMEDAVTQHRLVIAERELLERTLRGSVRALLETLALANPLAFSRAERIKSRVQTLVRELEIVDTWEIELTAMLSQLGAVTLPPKVTEALHAGDPLHGPVRELVGRLPSISVELIAGVPRLDGVRRGILFQDQRYDGRGHVTAGTAGEDIPLAARILRVALDYDAFEARRTPARVAVAELRDQKGLYDPDVLDALERVVTTGLDDHPIEQVRLDELRSGMVLAADLKTADDVLLWGRGQEVTQRLIDRLHNWSQHYDIVEPIEVVYEAEVAAADLDAIAAG